MPSLIADLITRALDESESLDSLLRRVKATATLLEVEDLAEWAEHELHGYSGDDEIPGYRMLTGEAQGWSIHRGCWVPIVWESQDDRRHVSTWPIRDSIGENSWLS
jgi:hypothetical protein